MNTRRQELDRRMMALAIEQGQKGLGHTRPNPAVGAIVGTKNNVISTGYHKKAGSPHAEVRALDACRLPPEGATLYVTLEPCDHQGRTPPCTRRILESGIARVVVGCVDPNPRVQGRGIRRLRQAGVEVEVGVCQDDCERLIAGYRIHVQTGLPQVLLKAACSLDGRIATRSGDSRGLSGPESQAHLHALRARCDAIVVGVNTVLADDPRLTPRLDHPLGEPDLLRVVLDSRARTPPSARLLRQPGSTLIAVTRRAPEHRVQALRRRGAEVCICRQRDGRVSLKDLLRRLGRRGLTTALFEGGGQVHGELLRQRLADRVILYVSPRLIGGDGVPLLAGEGRARIEMSALLEPRWTPLGDDILLEARCR